jgi:hypothetical protein
MAIYKEISPMADEKISDKQYDSVFRKTAG